MDELPAAIQNEIWEYVHGNRAYWKQQFSQVTAKITTWRFVRISRPVKGFTVRLCNHDPEAFDTYIFANDEVVDFLISFEVEFGQKSAVLELEIWTNILRVELARSESGFLNLETLYRARNEWRARSYSH